MKLFWAILAGTFLIMPVHSLRAGVDSGLTSSANMVQSKFYSQDGEEKLLHASLRERIVALQQNISSALSRRQSQGTSRLKEGSAPHSLIYLPDSLILFCMSDTLRMTASYNLRGWNDQIVVQVWYGGHWVNYSRQTWTYLGSNENNLTLQQIWFNGQWINSELDSSTYDERGNMLVHLFKHWSQGAWKDSILSSRTYDANGNMLTNEGWYMINHQWTNSDRTTYTYDSGGNRLSSLSQFWIGGEWINSDLITYTYDINGHMLTMMRQVWNGQWQYATLSTYTHDANGNMQSWLFQISASGHWTNSTIHTYTYNANGKMLTDWLKGWTNEAWMNGSLTTDMYDANGNMVNEVLQYWLNGSWTNSRQSTFTYDTNGNELTGNNTMWSGSSWVPTDYSFALAVAGSTYNFTGYRIIVSWILVNTTDVSGERSNIVAGYALSQNYPNPFNPTTTISFDIPKSSNVNLRIFDILGREIATLVNEHLNAGSFKTTWDANGVPSGTYFYRLQSGSSIETKKLVILR